MRRQLVLLIGFFSICLKYGIERLLSSLKVILTVKRL